MNQIKVVFILLSTILISNTVSAQFFEWAKFIGDTASAASGQSVIADKDGNVFTAFKFAGSADFDPGPMTFNLVTTPSTVYNIAISKLDANGYLVWAKPFISSTNQSVNSITLDDSAYIYVTGSFTGTIDFDPGPANYFLNSPLQHSLFVCKLDSAGNFKWATAIGNGLSDFVGQNIITDIASNVWVAGTFGDSVDFDPGPASSYLYAPSNIDLFFLKLDKSGNFIRVGQIGGPSTEYAVIATDTSGNIYLSGLFSDSADVDPGPGSHYLISNGQSDAFICKLDSTGSFLWGHNIGGLLADGGTSVAIDYSKNVYFVGTFRDTLDFDPGPTIYNLYGSGTDNIFILTLDSLGNFVWAGQLSGNSSLVSANIIFDKYENLYLGGVFVGQADFDPGPGNFMMNTFGHYLPFICKIHVSGNLLWAVQLSGISVSHQCHLFSLNADSLGKVYATGQFDGTMDFDPGIGIYSNTGWAYLDAFVLKLSETPTAISEYANNEDGIVIAPNPVYDQISIRSLETGIIKIEIFDILGSKKYFKKNLKHAHTEEIDLSKFSSGIYFVKVVLENREVSLKLIKN